MKILYTSEYKGDKICGVLTRVNNESEWMQKRGYGAYILSAEDFGPLVRISDNTSLWNLRQLKKEIIDSEPDIIVCNTYRHLETHTCLNAAKKLKIPCVLVTHAPFLESGVRGKVLSAATWLYDRFFSRVNEFSAIIGISRWEIPYLCDLGVKANKFHYIPNALPDELFKNQKSLKPLNKSKLKLLFLGRIVPIKDIPTLLKAISLFNSNNIELTIAGPFKKEYRDFLVDGVDKLGIQDKTCFVGSINSLKDKIDIINEHDILVLPSKREGMPQTLLEAMALGKIVISSRNQGALEIIKQGQNGFLFNIGDPEDLYKQLCYINNLNEEELKKISKAAIETASLFSANRIYPQTEKIYLSLISNKQ